MRSRPNRLLTSAALVFVAATTVALAREGLVVTLPIQSPDRQIAKSPNYLGSASCKECHETQHEDWQASLHIRMTKPIAEATVIGDFSAGASFKKFGRAYRFEKNAMAISHGGGPFQKFSVDYTLGFKRFQGYISRLPDGRMYVLPAFWHRENQRWIDWKEIAPVPDGTHDLRQIWNVTCFNCHATNLSKNFDVATRTYDTAWTEMGIGCEACHGPGEAHVALMRGWQTDPATRPAYDDSSRNRDLGKVLRIFSPRSADPRLVYETCTYCHGNKRNYLTGFVPGDRVANYAEPFLMSEPIPDNDPQGEFWPDGKPSRFNRPQALMLSGCFKSGRITCTNCHVAHGSKHEHSLKVAIRESAPAAAATSESSSRGAAASGAKGDPGAPGSKNEPPRSPVVVLGLGGAAAPRALNKEGRERFTKQSDLLCVQCHKDVGARDQGSGTGQTRVGDPAPAIKGSESSSGPVPDPRSLAPDPHTHHAPDSQGSRCIACHMADLNWRILIRRRDHTFQAPVPELTARFGEPNACTTCHDDKSPEWAARQMDQWYGDAERRRQALVVGETFYAAGAGDRAALPGLAKLAVDRKQGAFIRASAADYIGRLLTAPGTAAASSSAPSAQTAFEREEKPVDAGARGQGSGAGKTVTPIPDPRPPIPTMSQYVNTLIGAASDPEAMVRIAAVQALGGLGDRRAVPPLVARTQDEARVVRSSAAASLFLLGTVWLDGAPGAALARAQDDYVASLETFADQAGDHALLAYFESARGNSVSATREIDAALHLDAGRPQFHLFKGIILARLGRLKEAIAEWQTVRRLDPTDTSAPRLIAEAERQLGIR